VYTTVDVNPFDARASHKSGFWGHFRP